MQLAPIVVGLSPAEGRYEEMPCLLEPCQQCPWEQMPLELPVANQLYLVVELYAVPDQPTRAEEESWSGGEMPLELLVMNRLHPVGELSPVTDQEEGSC